jgi:hypothetical protein
VRELYPNCRRCGRKALGQSVWTAGGGLPQDSSGKGKEGRRLSTHELLSEFQNHKTFSRKQPTIALILATVSFIGFLRRALNKLYMGDEPTKF